MNQEKQPEAMRLADEFKLCNEHDCLPSMNDIDSAAAELRRLHALAESQRSELVAEAARTAEEKLSADQMTEQHRMQCNISKSAVATLVGLGYTDRGGEQWAPPIGKAPDFNLLDAANAQIAELQAQLYEIGAGGVEALRKRECLQQSAEITDAEIDRIAESMPGGLDGFLKAWGWRQFARAILQAAPPAPAEHAATLWVEENGCIDFETSPFFVKPPGEYQLYTAPPAPAAVAVPDGWKLVPVEPQDMQQAAGAQAIRFDTTLVNKMWTANKVYREMVARAPECAVLAAAPAQEHATQLAGQGQEPSPPVAVTGPVEWPATCDGLEQEAWEAWARVQRFDMSEHPMHYLFLNERTDAARQGWKGGFVYAVEQMKQRVHVVEAAPAQAQEDATQGEATAAQLEAAWRDGWAKCRDAEQVDQEAEDWAFSQSQTNSIAIDATQLAGQGLAIGWILRSKSGHLGNFFTTNEGHADNYVRDSGAEKIAVFTAAPVQAHEGARDADFEAVRKVLCKLPKYSFLIDTLGNLRRSEDASGNWVEFDAVHKLFDPVAVDAARTAQGGA